MGSENQKLFYSSREIIFTENSTPTDFSTMKADQAWNYGVSKINSFKLFDLDNLQTLNNVKYIFIKHSENLNKL